ncbi:MULTISPECIES: sialic acid TRAP transporter substrate-binding protein SiaP [Marinomonas]|jgi:TRAP-type C4-dicarboxylate transport system, periplasmic component|uniref:Extracellular solute-binding protein, family 7 n=2 Tax=Marinomonas TaxID=28253 RepID=F2JX82_MARM1|nr:MULTISPECIES: sialic acid TRAP transporter substrate-binding protein SiaP [Marinomonas]ADZ90688.1 Extracellular solute-binding protein, family 7 [Marinomonas mediterranea MMB-1]TDO98978.1 tripartite ATP-independent transporter DctP family solute receptor [Marinomonas balearica]WCN12782.1 C4-dicarboxylate ABC transporter [Marinomonas mediterranea]WCN16853.1 C4-dicarboxylate ABC transporter [Marinomonas mediterranea MMB-1]
MSKLKHPLRSTKRWITGTTLIASVLFAQSSFAAPEKLRLSAATSPTDQRAIALTEVFAKEIQDITTFEPHWNAALFKQGTELEAMARGNLDMTISSAQQISEFFPEFSIFTAGYVMQDAEHQQRVFNADFMTPLKEKVEEDLGVKLLSVMYLGRRQVNLRTDDVIETPADLKGVKMRMPGTESWQFLGNSLGANATPMPFSEVYTGLQTGAIDGQDNPLPTDKDAKFYEVTKQIVLTSHLVDFNYIAISMSAWEEFSEDEQARIQKAADNAAESARQKQLSLEENLVQFFRDKGLKVYTPNVEAFRTHVQEEYLKSDLSKTWPTGMLEKINALGSK